MSFTALLGDEIIKTRDEGKRKRQKQLDAFEKERKKEQVKQRQRSGVIDKVLLKTIDKKL